MDYPQLVPMEIRNEVTGRTVIVMPPSLANGYGSEILVDGKSVLKFSLGSDAGGEFFITEDGKRIESIDFAQLVCRIASGEEIWENFKRQRINGEAHGE